MRCFVDVYDVRLSISAKHAAPDHPVIYIH